MIGVLIQSGNLETETHAYRENAMKVKAELSVAMLLHVKEPR